MNKNILDGSISEEALRSLRVETHITFGRNFLQKGDYERALNSFREALVLSPGEPRALTGLSFSLTRLSRFDDALAAADDLIRIQPAYPGAYCARAVCLHAMGREDEAEEAFRQSIAIGPGDASAFYNFACYWAARGRPDLCRQYLEEALRLRPGMNVVAATDVDLRRYREEEWFQELIAFKR